MEVFLDPSLLAKLVRLATERGHDAESLAREAVERFVDFNEWFVREVEGGLVQVDRAEVLSHERVGARLDELVAAKRRRL